MTSFSLPKGYQFENYMIEGELGSGGFGITYLARDVALETKFAIKEYIPSEFAYRADNYRVIPKSNSDKDLFEWGLKSFLDEARTLVRFNDCDNIVKVYRYFEANGTAYFVMEYIEGDTFSALLKKNSFQPNEIENIFYGVLNGLKRIHLSKVLHKDIKPSNIMIKGNIPVLIDFGSARKNTPGKEHTKIITERYSPIEQYNENQDFGDWTDIYSLSATFYRAVVGQAPPEATSRIIDDKCMILLYERPEGYSKDFLNLIDQGLKILPKNRPQSISEWQNSLLRKKNFLIIPRLSFLQFKKSDNFWFNAFRGGFIVSGFVAFLAIGSMIFPDISMDSDSRNIEIVSKSNSIIDKNQSNLKIKSKRIEALNFSINKAPWKTIKLSESFNIENYNHVSLESNSPFRIRFNDSKPILVKKQIKYKLSNFGGYMDIKSVANSSTVKIIVSKE